MCVYMYRKEEYPALKILIRNKLKKKKKTERGAEAFSVFLFFGSFGCFVRLFFSTEAARGFNCQVYKNIEERM